MNGGTLLRNNDCAFDVESVGAGLLTRGTSDVAYWELLRSRSTEYDWHHLLRYLDPAVECVVIVIKLNQ